MALKPAVVSRDIDVVYQLIDRAVSPFAVTMIGVISNALESTLIESPNAFDLIFVCENAAVAATRSIRMIIAFFILVSFNYNVAGCCSAGDGD